MLSKVVELWLEGVIDKISSWMLFSAKEVFKASGEEMTHHAQKTSDGWTTLAKVWLLQSNVLLLHLCPCPSSRLLNWLSVYLSTKQNLPFPSRPNSATSNSFKLHRFVSSLNSLFWIIYNFENLMKAIDLFPQGICFGICACILMHPQRETHTHFKYTILIHGLI